MEPSAGGTGVDGRPIQAPRLAGLGIGSGRGIVDGPQVYRRLRAHVLRRTSRKLLFVNDGANPLLLLLQVGCSDQGRADIGRLIFRDVHISTGDGPSKQDSRQQCASNQPDRGVHHTHESSFPIVGRTQEDSIREADYSAGGRLEPTHQMLFASHPGSDVRHPSEIGLLSEKGRQLVDAVSSHQFPEPEDVEQAERASAMDGPVILQCLLPSQVLKHEVSRQRPFRANVSHAVCPSMAWSGREPRSPTVHVRSMISSVRTSWKPCSLSALCVCSTCETRGE